MNLKHCHVDRLEETALAVSTPKSPRYGRYLSSRDVCEIIACPDRDEAVGRVLHWLLGEVSSDIASAQGTWNAKGKEDDVLVKVKRGGPETGGVAPPRKSYVDRLEKCVQGRLRKGKWHISLFCRFQAPTIRSEWIVSVLEYSYSKDSKELDHSLKVAQLKRA